MDLLDIIKALNQVFVFLIGKHYKMDTHKRSPDCHPKYTKSESESQCKYIFLADLSLEKSKQQIPVGLTENII